MRWLDYTILLYMTLTREEAKWPKNTIFTLNTLLSPETNALLPLHTMPKREFKKQATHFNVKMHQTRSWRGEFLKLYPAKFAKTICLWAKSEIHSSSFRRQPGVSTEWSRRWHVRIASTPNVFYPTNFPAHADKIEAQSFRVEPVIETIGEVEVTKRTMQIDEPQANFE